MSKGIVASATGCLLMALTLGCQSANRSMDASEAAPPPAGRFAAQQAAPEVVAEQREVIRNGSQKVEVEDLDPALVAIEAALAERGGHLQLSNRSERFVRLTLRVPSEHLDAIMDRIAELGKETERSTSRQDVTEQVRDLEAEFANQQALRDRFRELAKRAQTVEDILKVERELARVQSRVDSLTGRLARLRSQVAMSELRVTLIGPEAETRSIPGPLQLLVRGVTWVATKLWVIEY